MEAPVSRKSRNVIISLFLLVGLYAVPSLDDALAQGVVTTREASPTNLETYADVTVTGTATLVRAATINRVNLNCTNTSSSVHVRWGDSNVTATRGQQLRAGRSIQIPSSDAVYMISEGANVSMSCTEELR